jgi:hypothetical protein
MGSTAPPSIAGLLVMGSGARGAGGDIASPTGPSAGPPPHALLAAGAVSHNHPLFPKDSRSVSTWAIGSEPTSMLRSLRPTLDLSRCPSCKFFIARRRALAAIGRDARRHDVIPELRRLTAETERHGCLIALPALRSRCAHRPGRSNASAPRCAVTWPSDAVAGWLGATSWGLRRCGFLLEACRVMRSIARCAAPAVVDGRGGARIVGFSGEG